MKELKSYRYSFNSCYKPAKHRWSKINAFLKKTLICQFIISCVAKYCSAKQTESSTYVGKGLFSLIEYLQNV